MDETPRPRRRKRAPEAILPERALELLTRGEIDIQGAVSWSSNYTFVVRVSDAQGETHAIYKPARGERPLWDFDEGTLCKREVAAYLLSVWLGFPNIPPTVLRSDGPHGIGSLQLLVETENQEHYFTLRGRYPAEMKRIAVFDALTNNTDRKGGHVLLGRDGQVWAIDHGVTFHEDPKLRTVIWDFVGEAIPEDLILQLCALQEDFSRRDPRAQKLREYLSPGEVTALRGRLAELISTRIFPAPPEDWPHIPWPPV